MPIVKDPKEVEEIYNLLREKNVRLPAFCTESFPRSVWFGLYLVWLHFALQNHQIPVG